MSDEFLRIAEIIRRLRSEAEGVRLGMGDDAAVLEAGGAPLVMSVDSAVEGVHFSRDWASWHEIGYRSLVASLSDLAAMGAGPRAALTAFILPVDFPDRELFELTEGLAEAAKQYGCAVVGGNLSRGAEVSITSTVIGQADGGVLTRAGAGPGDGIFVTGKVGSAALGLRCLQLGRAADGGEFVERWRRPAARIARGQELVGKATAAIDISDGLLQDLGHLCAASGLGARLDAGALPLAEGFSELSLRLDCDPLKLALSGGEDYELIFTAPEGSPAQRLGSRIGSMVAEPRRVVVRDQRGELVLPESSGYAHWREG